MLHFTSHNKKKKDTCTVRSKRKKNVNKSENNEAYCFLM